jgi:predicted MFS family arabinose efflux permease
MTGMSLLVPAVTWLVLTTGWRITYVLIAGLILVIALPLCLWVLRDSPESIGLTADGAEPRPGAATASVERVTAGEALGTLAFWQLAGSFFTCGFSMSLLSAHGIPMLTDHGYSPMLASWALGVLGGSSIGFTVMLGALSDRFGRRPVPASIYAGRVLIFAGFFLIRDNPTAILAVAVLGGITMAGTGSMTSALTADIYGRFSVSSVFGLIFLVHQTGSALGSWLAGALFAKRRSRRTTVERPGVRPSRTWSGSTVASWFTTVTVSSTHGSPTSSASSAPSFGRWSPVATSTVIPAAGTPASRRVRMSGGRKSRFGPAG